MRRSLVRTHHQADPAAAKEGPTLILHQGDQRRDDLGAGIDLLTTNERVQYLSMHGVGLTMVVPSRSMAGSW
jgi:hypothetical protein